MSLTLRYAARSDRGLIREGNEDSVYAGPRLLAVADGMGGMAAGEVASNIVVGALAPLDEDVSSDLIEALHRAIDQANQQLRNAVESNPALEGMGTTLTAMLFSGNRIALVHVGDSRAYVMHDGQLSQITRDDTYVQMLVDEGRITADEANTHPQRSLLTRALDGREVEPDFSIREARIGDRYLLCSDGLSGVVTEETMAEALRTLDPREAADRLIQLALRGGGPDNITCIVADIIDELIDEAPVVGGAAARDRTTSAGTDTAAGRAAFTALPLQEANQDEEVAEEVEKPPKRRRKWAILGVLGAILLLTVGSYAAWYYTQQQYYVGTTNTGNVAIYRGVAGSIAGIKFSSLEAETDLRTNDLQQVAQRDVSQTIPARNKSDAAAIVDRLRSRQLPLCPDSGVSTNPNSHRVSPSPTPTQSAGNHPGGTPSPNNSSATTPASLPTPRQLAKPSPQPSGQVTVPPTSLNIPLPTQAPQPGENCREPR